MTQEDVKEEVQMQRHLYGEAALARVKEAMGAIPESPELDPLELATRVLFAENVNQLDQPWNTDSMAQFENVRITITDVKRLESELPGGMGWFLVVDGVLTGTKEPVTFTTGSISVMLQIARAYELDALPLAVIVRRAQRPSKSGFYPYHLEIERAGSN